MKLLFLHRGTNSGTNQALLKTWRAAVPHLRIEVFDVDRAVLAGPANTLRALPHALAKAGPAALLKGTGRFLDAIKSTTWFYEKAAQRIQQLHAEERFDLVFGMGTLIPIHTLDAPAFLYTDQPILANRHFPGGEERIDFWRDCLPVEQANLRHAARVFTMSNHSRRVLLEQYNLPEEKVICVGAGYNAPPPQQPHPRRFERKNILFIGLDWHRKGGPELLQAFRIVRQKHPHATLTIVGCRPHVTCDGVEIVGPVSTERVSDYLAGATVFCMTSRREPFGLAYIEAMAAGLPVVASDLGATPDFVRNGRTGYRVPFGDIEALANRLDELISDPQKCRRMGRQARALVQANYTWRHTQRKIWTAICDSIASSTPEMHPRQTANELSAPPRGDST